jgi:hypothetical protein
MDWDAVRSSPLIAFIIVASVFKFDSQIQIIALLAFGIMFAYFNGPIAKNERAH